VAARAAPGGGCVIYVTVILPNICVQGFI
jgi:hypothetical protein